MVSFIINSLFLCQIINMVTIGGIIIYPRLDRVQSTEYKDASHPFGMTSTRLSIIHKAQTPSPAGLPLTQGESF